MLGKILYTGGVDLVVTHAPALGYGDMQDLPHRGFDCFNRLLDRLHPVCMLHGHVHKSYGAFFVRERKHRSGTRVINAYESFVLDIPQSVYHPFGHANAFLYDCYCRLLKRVKREESVMV